MSVVAFTRHRLHRPARCAAVRYGDCVVCTGGLILCEVCGGSEASLPTDCPGYDMPAEVAEDVTDGLLDYRRRAGGWIRASNADMIGTAEGDTR